ncbi:MAG TPA: hypothetical protein V6C63_14360 [Allocoleopsis sp.]
MAKRRHLKHNHAGDRLLVLAILAWQVGKSLQPTPLLVSILPESIDQALVFQGRQD